MKLRLQIANMLPVSPEPGPTGCPGKGSFGTAMEEMLASSLSGKPSLVVTPYAFLQKQPQTVTHLESGKPEQAISDSAEERNATKEFPAGRSFAQSPREQATGQSAKAALFSEELPPEQTSLVPIGHAPTQNPMVRELRAISLQSDHRSQSLADAALSDGTSIKDASSRAKHKAETMGNEPMHPVNGQAAGVLPVVSQPIDAVVPKAPLQLEGLSSNPGGLQPAPLISGSKAENDHARGHDASRRVPVPAMVLSHGEQRSTLFTVPTALTMPQPQAMVGGRLPESPSSDGKSESSTKMHPASQSTGNANAGATVLPNQGLHPQTAHSADGLETNTKQTDTHALKDTEKTIGIEVKPNFKTSAAGYPASMPPITQQPALPNLPPALSHGAEKAMAMPHSETSATQVLQKMDFAGPSGVIQLRADARRLDVGVTSGALGWVEVRATTGPSGRVDATLHVQNDVAAQVLTSQSREISDYAREHSVQLGQVSVGVGTGDSTQSQSHSTPTRDGNETRVRGSVVRPVTDSEQSHHAAEAVSLISVRA